MYEFRLRFHFKFIPKGPVNNIAALVQIMVPKGPINNIPALVQIMAWRRPGNKALSELKMVDLVKHICLTRP